MCLRFSCLLVLLCCAHCVFMFSSAFSSHSYDSGVSWEFVIIDPLLFLVWPSIQCCVVKINKFLFRYLKQTYKAARVTWKSFLPWEDNLWNRSTCQSLISAGKLLHVAGAEKLELCLCNCFSFCLHWTNNPISLGLDKGLTPDFYWAGLHVWTELNMLIRKLC